MRVVGLTGGIACGKSAVAKILTEKGIPVIDTDELAHRVLDQDAVVKERVSKRFGTTERRKLREAIFSDPALRKALEAILHPPIAAALEKELQALRLNTPPPRVAVVVVPLLFEVGWDDLFDGVIAVTASHATQVRRLMERDRISEKLAEAMLRSQMAPGEKARRASQTIRNEGTLEDLRKSVEKQIKEFTNY